MKSIRLLPEELQCGMEVFIYGHHIIEFEKPCIVSRLYSPTDRTKDLEFDEFYVEEGVTFTISDYNLTNGEIAVFTKDESKVADGWTDAHYSFKYYITEQDTENGNIKIDPYFVSKQWQLGKKDDTGTIFHILKTIARFGDKNSKEREIKALYAQVVRLAELEGVALN